VFIWIDATHAGAESLVFGMTLLERLLRALVDSGIEPNEVRIDLPEGSHLQRKLPGDLVAVLPLVWSEGSDSLPTRLKSAHEAARGKPLLALSAETVVDARLLTHMAQQGGATAFIGGEGDERGALLRLEARLPDLDESASGLLTIAEKGIACGALSEFSAARFDGYIRNLRRSNPPYLFRITAKASRRRVERFLFWSNYKGSTDFMTKYVYPPAVWIMVRPLARMRVHPNWVTGVDILATIAAIPYFVAGQWLPGLLLAYLMSVLDSVDGKLARLTYRSSKIGEVMDHGLDIVHPPFWYLAWGWALGGGTADSFAYQMAVLMFVLYVLDRLTAMVFINRVGRSIHGHTPLDERMRTFISRRNVNLPLFTLAIFVDWVTGGVNAALYTFYAIVAWQAVCLVFHVERVAQFWNAGSSGEA